MDTQITSKYSNKIYKNLAMSLNVALMDVDVFLRSTYC